jgi:glycosyltransferase involved in cell wall biosynthesis
VEGTTRTIRVFNKSNHPIFWVMVGADEEDTEKRDFHPGQWTEVSEDLANAYLWKDNNLIIDWGTKPASPRGYMPLPHLVFSSPIDCLTGYGSASAYFIPFLAKHFHTHLYPLGYWPPGDWREEVLAPLTTKLMDEANMLFCEWAVALTIPTELPKVPAKNIILYSMWETNELPGGWVDATNEYAQHLVVPCHDQAQVWLDSGVTVPVSVIPLGVDTSLWAYKERPPRTNGEPFTILSYGLLSSRKSPIETFTKVCWRALDDKEDWKLILKSRGNQFGGGEFAPVIQDERVEQISANYRPEEMVDLCHKADCGIFLSRFEGFGLPPREMMATGLPVIWSAHSGHLEDCFQGVTVDIPISGIIPAQDLYTGLGGWGEPDWEKAAEALRAQYEVWHARGKTQSQMGTDAADYIRATRQWRHTADMMASLVRQLANE